MKNKFAIIPHAERLLISRIKSSFKTVSVGDSSADYILDMDMVVDTDMAEDMDLVLPSY